MAELHKHVLKGLEKAELLLDQFPMIALNSGVTVCNFSSFHSYKFNTGETLPKCTKETADRHSMKTIEHKTERWKGFETIETNRYVHQDWSYLDTKEHAARLNKEGIAWFKEKGLDRDNPDWYDLELNMLIQKHTLKDLTVLANMDKLDIILIPRPVQEILNENWQNDPDIYKIRLKARTCRKLDSRDNSQGIYSNKFCR